MHIRTFSLAALLTALLGSLASGEPTPEPLLLRGGFPRSGAFRTSEWTAASTKSGSSYRAWEQQHAGLGGIFGKVLGEESLGTETKNQEGLTKLDYFNRYKQQFPEKLVLLHFNGNARMSVYRPGALFAGHWLYYAPARVLSAVPATGGETLLRVSALGGFSLEEGKFRDKGTDLCLVRTRGGAVDWSHTEQATVSAIDQASGSITVRRAQYGTAARSFAAGEILAFPHVTEGPFGPKKQKSPLLWKYNFSLDAPRDPQGRILADTLSDELAGLFAADGMLRLFDGIEFDAMTDQQHPQGMAARQHIKIDFNGDGTGDDGLRDGLPQYGLGQRRFLEELRRKVGPEKLLMADLGQRGFGILNGVESEGFPRSKWYDFVLWSERMNKLCYWAEHSANPQFSLIAGKFEAEQDEETDGQPDFVPLSAARLQIAASALCGAAYFPFLTRNDDAKSLLIWDELVMGQVGRSGWLGMPLGEAVYLSESLGDELAGMGPQRLSSPSGAIKLQGQTAVATGRGSHDVAFTLPSVPYKNNALLVTMALRGDPRRGVPVEYARLLTVTCGQRVKTWHQEDLALESYIGPEPFTARFYFSSNRYEIHPPADPCDLRFTVEGPEPVYVERLEIRNAPDAAYREFQHGLVLANPSDRPFTFDLDSLFPGRTFTRLKATPGQDATVNDGKPAGKTVTIPARDALFVLRTN